MSHDKVRVLHEDNNGILWIGTESGLNSFNKADGSFSMVTSEDGLIDNTITGIVSDCHDRLWVSTKNGLSKMDVVTKDVHSFTESDAFESNEFFAGAHTVGKDGTLYFGGFQGLLTLHPDALELKDPDILLNLTGISINHKSHHPLLQSTDPSGCCGMTFHYKQNHIRFNYVGINFQHSRHIQYAYQLEGFDRSWNYVGNSKEATYSNLPPGKYRFMLKASVGNNQWLEPQMLMRFEIDPPFWKTWWAKLFYIVLIIIWVAMYKWYVIRKERRKSDLKFALFQKDLKEQLDSLKIKFYADISKELQSPFNLIRRPLQKLISENDSISPETRMTYFKLISQNARKVITLIEQLSDISRFDAVSTQLSVSNYDIIHYCQQLSDVLRSKADKRHLGLVFESNKEAAEVYFDVAKLEKIMHSLISYAVQRAHPNSQVIIGLELHTVESPELPSGLKRVKKALEFAKITVGHACLPMTDQKEGVDDFRAEEQIVETNYAMALVKQLTAVHLGTFNLSMDEEKTNYTVWLPVDKDVFKTDELIPVPDVEVRMMELKSYLSSELLEDRFAEVHSFSENTADPGYDDSPFMVQLYEIVDAQLADDQFGPDHLADYMNLSRSQLYKKVKSFTKLSVSILIRNRRLSKSLELLSYMEHNISEIAYAVGFRDPGYFTKCFKEMYGKSPSEFVQADGT